MILDNTNELNSQLLSIVKNILILGNYTIEDKLVHLDKPKIYNKWIYARPKNRNVNRLSGWKIHISSTTQHAEDILKVVVPSLVSHEVCFKFTDSIDFLAALNNGKYGISAVGKFITIYPYHDEQLRLIAESIYPLTKNFIGPKIFSDRQYKNDGIIYYRWGAFLPNYIQSIYGAVISQIPNHLGENVLDIYSYNSSSTKSINDPFGVDAKNHHTEIIAGKYIKVHPIHIGSSTEIYLGYDKVRNRRCIIKIGYNQSQLDVAGNLTSERLKFEKIMMERLQNKINVPQIFDDIEEANRYCLVMEDIYNEPIDSSSMMTKFKFGFPKIGNTTKLVLEILSLLEIVHNEGIIHGDIKLSNLLINRTNKVYLIDFNSASDTKNGIYITTCGTEEFASPQRKMGKAPSILDDIYSIGAVMYYLFTGIDHHQLNINGINSIIKPSYINPSINHQLDNIICRCLEANEFLRYQSIKEVKTDILKCQLKVANNHTDILVKSKLIDPLKYAGYFQDILVNKFYSKDDIGSGFSALAKTNVHLFDLRGTAGVLLSFIDLYISTRQDKIISVIEQCANSICSFTPNYNELPGLYVGSSAIAVAVYLVGYVFNNEYFSKWAREKLLNVANFTNDSLDLINGRAGYLRALLMIICLEKNYNSSLLKLAQVQVDFILDKMLPDEMVWLGLDAFCEVNNPKFTEEKSLLYAHGASGIADALLDYYLVTGAEKIKKVILNIYNMLLKHLVEEECSIYWPGDLSSEKNSNVASCYWCGAGGIIKFIIRLYKYKIVECDHKIIDHFAKQIYSVGRSSLPIQCHGIVGNIEILLDIYQLKQEARYLSYAQSLAALIKYWSSDVEKFNFNMQAFQPKNWLTGIPGIISCLARFSDFDKRPHLLSIEYSHWLSASR